MTLEDFLERNRLTVADWANSGCNWETLSGIAKDHIANNDNLLTTAEMFARMIQRIEGVHSVRFRIKDVEHLLEKIIRKCCEGVEKYKRITAENYHEVVTDLVGIRALHLFKDDCFKIDEGIRKDWQLTEAPKAYVRAGDPDEFREALRAHGLEVEEHKAGYRSVHYVASSRPGKRDIYVEIQVRTIFEEGWSEIDHKIRYPNFSDNPLLAYFLTIFNRMAGAADEMGSFVQLLAEFASAVEEKQNAAESERDAAIIRMENALAHAKKSEEKSAEMSATLATLEAEMARLKRVAIDAIPLSSFAAGTVENSAKMNRVLAQVLSNKMEESNLVRMARALGGTGAIQIAKTLENQNATRHARLLAKAIEKRAVPYAENNGGEEKDK